MVRLITPSSSQCVQCCTYQFPKRVIFADGNIDFRAAGTFPEKAGRTEKQLFSIQITSRKGVEGELKPNEKYLFFLFGCFVVCIKFNNNSSLSGRRVNDSND